MSYKQIINYALNKSKKAKLHLPSNLPQELIETFWTFYVLIGQNKSKQVNAYYKGLYKSFKEDSWYTPMVGPRKNIQPYISAPKYAKALGYNRLPYISSNDFLSISLPRTTLISIIDIDKNGKAYDKIAPNIKSPIVDLLPGIKAFALGTPSGGYHLILPLSTYANSAFIHQAISIILKIELDIEPKDGDLEIRTGYDARAIRAPGTGGHYFVLPGGELLNALDLTFEQRLKHLRILIDHVPTINPESLINRARWGLWENPSYFLPPQTISMSQNNHNTKHFTLKSSNDKKLATCHRLKSILGPNAPNELGAQGRILLDKGIISPNTRHISTTAIIVALIRRYFTGAHTSSDIDKLRDEVAETILHWMIRFGNNSKEWTKNSDYDKWRIRLKKEVSRFTHIWGSLNPHTLKPEKNFYKSNLAKLIGPRCIKWANINANKIQKKNQRLHKLALSIAKYSSKGWRHNTLIKKIAQAPVKYLNKLSPNKKNTEIDLPKLAFLVASHLRSTKPTHVVVNPRNNDFLLVKGDRSFIKTKFSMASCLDPP